MKLAVNTRLLLPKKLDGIGWFSFEVLKRLVERHPDWEFHFLFDRQPSDKFKFGANVVFHQLSPPARHPTLYWWYFQKSIPKKLKAIAPDLFFSPDGFLTLKPTVPQIPVIHDINFEHRPEDLPRSYSHYYRYYFSKFAHKAEHILTVSEYSKRDIAGTYNIDPSHITVAHNGVSDQYQPISAVAKQASREAFASGVPYFIFVGNFHQRKNVHGIIRAFSEYKSSTGQAHKLVLVGDKAWKYREMEDALDQSDWTTDIVFTGSLGIEKLAQAMGGAEALLFPSFIEGFGIPVLEAMKCGVPVITSKTTALPEVGGEAALYCDPFRPEELAEQMKRIVTEDGLAHACSEQGLKQAQNFSWDKTTDAVESVLLKYAPTP